MNQLINFKVFVNMKKNLFLMAMAAVAFAACSDDFADAPPVVTPVDESAFEKPIVFNSSSSGMTRADFYGHDAAEKLGYKFVVSGYKGSTTTAWASDSKIVFDNFLVEWGDNTAHTTESNTNNWEYVGKGPIAHATKNGVTQQAIKYWDYTQTQYDFIAWSTGTKNPVYTDAALGTNDVRVSAIKPSTATGTSGVAFTMEGTVDNLSQCYIADLVTVYKDKTKNPTGMAYGDPVVLTFRSLGTKVRIAIYETIPGYSVKDVKFYKAADVALEDEDDATNGAENKTKNETARLFTTTTNDIYTQGIYTVFYPTVDDQTKADNNQAHISFEKTGTSQTTIVDWGKLNYTIAEDAEPTEGAVFLGRSSNTASFAGDPTTNYYVYYLPNEGGTNLNLRVNYTLESIDGTGENIYVKGATAQVPAVYAAWQPGFAYTYIFKISDKTNGHTGVYNPTKPDDTTVNSDPAGLYPITFDAVVVNSEDNGHTQETITTVSAPSITTYQQNSTVVNDNEYKAATGDIYVTVNDGTTENTPDLANGDLITLANSGDHMVALYDVVEGTTEAVVVDALQMRDDDQKDGNVVGRNGLVLKKTTSDALVLTNEVKYGADGNVIKVGTNQAAKFTPQANKTYAFVYFKKIKTGTDIDLYQPIDFATFTGTKYRYGYADAPGGDAQKGVIYFTKEGSVYTGKAPFLGQTVSNLYLDNTGSTIGSGYAVTGTDYYYTTDKGMHYKKATNIEYAYFKSATDLYTFDGTTYTLKTEASPADGTAYYQKVGDDYNYCVILPEQTTGWYVLDTTKHEKATETTAVVGMTYFDYYTKNNGVYYAKIIKVQ